MNVDLIQYVGFAVLVGVFGYLCYVAVDENENHNRERNYYIDYDGDIIFLGNEMY